MPLALQDYCAWHHLVALHKRRLQIEVPFSDDVGLRRQMVHCLQRYLRLPSVALGLQQWLYHAARR